MTKNLMCEIDIKWCTIKPIAGLVEDKKIRECTFTA